MARYKWVFPDKGTVSVYAENRNRAITKVKSILGRKPRTGRLIKYGV